MQQDGHKKRKIDKKRRKEQHNDKKQQAQKSRSKKLTSRSFLVPMPVMFPNWVNQQSLEELYSQWRSIHAESKPLLPQYFKSTEFFFWGGDLDELQNGLGYNSYSELCIFVLPIMSPPHSPACVECIFSVVSVVKTKSQNWLKPVHLRMFTPWFVLGSRFTTTPLVSPGILKEKIKKFSLNRKKLSLC